MMNEENARILVVDDEVGMREGCKKILRAEGFEVDTAEDGPTALQLCSNRRNFAVILVDLKMPGMSGMELIEKIRRDNTDAVIVVITAYATIQTAVEATKKGAYGYIPKPFTPDELLIPVRNGITLHTLSLQARALQQERDGKMLELMYERSKCSTILQCMSDGVVVVNLDSKVVMANEAAMRLITGATRFQLPLPLQRLAWPELQAVLAGALAAQPRQTIISEQIMHDGHTYMVNASPLEQHANARLGAVAVMRDITELTRLETAKAAFISMVSHEITSHLGVVEGYLNEISRRDIVTDATECHHMLDRAIVRARTLRLMVSDLMNLGAIETGHFKIKKTPVRILDVIKETVASCREAARKNDIDLAMNDSCKTAELKVLADKEALLSIFKNLVDNAIKYTPAAGHIHVAIEQHAGFITANVIDNGIGIAEENRQKIFEEFYRIRNRQTSHIAGTGLGLSIVKRLVDMHNGAVEVTSSPGKGSIFSVTLPALNTEKHGKNEPFDKKSISAKEGL
jgi:PAS domain S-box-containing protein